MATGKKDKKYKKYKDFLEWYEKQKKKEELKMKERLTKKREDGFYDDLDECVCTQCSNKLGLLEDIEEELGIDLLTYFKYAKAKTAFSKEKYGNQECIEECYVTGITLEGIILMPKAFPYGDCEFTREFKGYGKTWALTREELEK